MVIIGALSIDDIHPGKGASFAIVRSKCHCSLGMVLVGWAWNWVPEARAEAHFFGLLVVSACSPAPILGISDKQVAAFLVFDIASSDFGRHLQLLLLTWTIYILRTILLGLRSSESILTGFQLLVVVEGTTLRLSWSRKVLWIGRICTCWPTWPWKLTGGTELPLEHMIMCKIYH